MNDADQLLGPTDDDKEEDASEAFVRTVNDAAGPLFCFALRLTGNTERAEDVVQETLLRAWRHAASARGAPTPRPWLFRVARNLIIDLWRSDLTRPVIVSDDDVVSAVPANDQFERAVQCWDLAAALRRLEPHHRETLTVVYLEDRTVADAARRLGIPTGTVKSRTHHALRALRVVLETQRAL
ncbi:sigma-70 family RNA polymerase sigma factor [Pseudonocardia xinjiangensis]|uniref:sigma-70 family RNA polymerase sigma factor n=1 Tax=Pseudonocardia xinjiangensis TaxID=75289 RepID=UPI003D8B33A7